MQNAIGENEIDLGCEDSRKRWERAFVSTDPIEKRTDMLAKNLDRETWRGRLSRAFVAQRVPEIWDVVVALEAFEGSFFESLAEQSRKGRTGKDNDLEPQANYCMQSASKTRRRPREFETNSKRV